MGHAERRLANGSARWDRANPNVPTPWRKRLILVRPGTENKSL